LSRKAEAENTDIFQMTFQNNTPLEVIKRSDLEGLQKFLVAPTQGRLKNF
jgi:hypothetical protein